jgi:nucleoside-diphosphate-sugar epimerase
VEWIPGDLGDGGALARLVAGTSVVIHCAGATRGATRADFDRVNVEGTRRLARAAAREPACRRFLLMSSLAARCPTLSDYAGSKRRGEGAVEESAEDLRWTVLRPPPVYGPGDRELAPLFRGIAHGFVPVPAGPRGRFSLLYVDDLAAAVACWLNADAGGFKTFELDDGRPGGYDWDTLVAMAARVLGGGRRVHRIPIPVALLRVAGRVNAAAARVLGYRPMLTPGKVRELTHLDWVSNSAEFTNFTGWRPVFGLERGLACTFGKQSTTLHGVSR